MLKSTKTQGAKFVGDTVGGGGGGGVVSKNWDLQFITIFFIAIKGVGKYSFIVESFTSSTLQIYIYINLIYSLHVILCVR